MRAPTPTTAILIAIIAIAAGSGIDLLVKAFAPDAGLLHLLAWRFLFGAIISIAVFTAKARPAPNQEAIRFHTLRGAIQLLSVFLFFYSLMHLPLALATTIGFTAALMIPPVARLILGEAISARALLATAVGFVGAALAITGMPSQQGPDGQRLLGIAACFGAAFLYAVTLVLLRLRATREDATTIAMFTNTVPAIALLPITLGLLGWPDWHDLPLFLGLGVLGYGVWFLMTLAYARAPAQRLAPLEYSALIWSGLFGAIFFSEYPGWPTWIGAAIIIVACLIVAFEDKFATRKRAGQPASDLPD